MSTCTAIHRLSITRLMVLCLGMALSCACARAGNAALLATQDKKQGQKEDAKKDKGDKDRDKNDKEAEKIATRNNAASLLADLLGNEKNVSKLLIIKHGSAATDQLVKTIAKTADDGSKRLQDLAKADNALKLDAMELPPGEKAAREAESKTDEHELLFTSGVKFEFNLLLTQAQALSYGSHLAKVAADNSSAPEAQREFHSLETSLNDLYERVTVRMRALPAESKT